MIRWRVDTDQDLPIPVECPEYGYPHVDADGETQFENTHFDVEADAWAYAKEGVGLRVIISARMVETQMASLASAREEHANALRNRTAFEDAQAKPRADAMTRERLTEIRTLHAGRWFFSTDESSDAAGELIAEVDRLAAELAAAREALTTTSKP